MPRKKSPSPASLLTHHLQTRVTQAVYQRLELLQKQSNCRSLGELTRRILSKEKIVVFQRDASLDAPMEELTQIRKELKAIGVNINQVTRQFHSESESNRKVVHALKVLEQYNKVGDRVEALLKMVNTLSKKWLQK